VRNFDQGAGNKSVSRPPASVYVVICSIAKTHLHGYNIFVLPGRRGISLTPDNGRIGRVYFEAHVSRHRTERCAIFSAARSFASRSSARNVPRVVPNWAQLIVIGRHAFADQYAAHRFVVPGRRHPGDDLTPEGAGEPITRKSLLFVEFPRRRCRGMGMYKPRRSRFGGFAQVRALISQCSTAGQLYLSTRIRSSSNMTAVSATCSRRSTYNEFAAEFKKTPI